MIDSVSPLFNLYFESVGYANKTLIYLYSI